MKVVLIFYLLTSLVSSNDEAHTDPVAEKCKQAAGDSTTTKHKIKVIGKLICNGQPFFSNTTEVVFLGKTESPDDDVEKVGVSTSKNGKFSITYEVTKTVKKIILICGLL